MAQKQHVIFVDDIDGSEAAGSVKFGLDGVEYEIDLSDDNAAKLRSQLQPWVAKARRISGRKTPGKGKVAGSASANSEFLTKVRSWARSQGHEVSDRGRVSQKLIDAYNKAN